MNGCRRRRRAGLLVVCLLWFAGGAAAQDAPLPAAGAAPGASGPAPPSGRPRICLVLSGGGALGIAHVGVLRELEAMRVPVDCVAGTSMGAIVGGLYAAGYAPDEIEALGTTLDWPALLRDAPDRRRLPFRRKMDDLTYLSRLEIGVSRQGFRMPSGFVAGHRIAGALRVLGLRAAGTGDFDRLPRPFRAVATDARTGEAVVLRGGDLGAAMHASMAIPGFFAPVEVDGRLLVDGGIVANLPVDAAREMRPDVVVAVSVGESAPGDAAPKPDSIGSILGTTLGAHSRREVQRALREADVAVTPQVGEFGVFDFEASATLIERGVEATRAHADALRGYALDEAAWAEHVAARRRGAPVLTVASVTVDPPGGAARAAAAAGDASRLVRTRPGDALVPERLVADLDRVWETGEYERVDFSVAPRPGAGGAVDLRIHPRLKSWGPNFLRAGVAIASDLEGSSRFDALAALTMTRLNRLGAELKVSVGGGEGTNAAAEIYQPLRRGTGPFVAAGVATGIRKAQVPVEDQPVQYRFVPQRFHADLGLALGRYGELRAGAVYLDVAGRATDDNRDDAPDYDRVDAGVHAGLTFDQLDQVNFPRHGLLVVTDVYRASATLGADADYDRWDLQAIGAASRGRHTLVGLFRGTSALGGQLPAEGRVQLGGLFNLSGLPPGEVSGSYGGTASLLYMFRLGRAPKIADGIYVGASVEAGQAWETAEDVDLSDLRHSFALVLGFDAVVGPVYLAHGWTSGGKDSLYLYVGRSF